MELLVITDRYRDEAGRFAHGAAVHLHQLSVGLAARSHRIRVLQWGERQGSHEERGAVVDTFTASCFTDFIERVAHEAARHQGPVHLNNVDCASALAARPGASLTATIHTNVFLSESGQLTLRELAGPLDALAVVNRRYVPALRGSGTPVVWLPSGVDTDVMAPAPGDASRDASLFRILLPARPIRAKGAVFAASLLPCIARRVGRPVELVYTGTPAKDVEAEIRACAGEQADAIRFLPWQDHGSGLARLYRSADVVILPSSSEACGLVLLEAMGCGTPVVASPEANTAGAVRHGQTGLCAPLDSRDAWANCLVELAHNRRLASRLGLAGARLVRRRHRLDAMVGGYEQFFRQMGAAA